MANLRDVSRVFGVTEAEARKTDEALAAAGLGWGDLLKYGPCIAKAIGCVIANPHNAARCGVDFVSCIVGEIGGGGGGGGGSARNA